MSLVFKNVIRTLAACVALGLAGVAGAVQVNVLDSYSVASGQPFSIVTTASDRDANGQPNGQAYTANYFYELVAGAFDTLTTFVLGSTRDETVPVRYFLWLDTNPTLRTAQIAAIGTAGNGLAQGALAETVPYLTVGQGFQYALQSGQQYVLQVQKNVPGWEAVTTDVTAVPLPGALWMFGAALMGFVGFSSRRKV